MDNWINVTDRVPLTDRRVLAVKELNDGTREICLARCPLTDKHYDCNTETYSFKPTWICDGNNNIIMWMDLPKYMNEEG